MEFCIDYSKGHCADHFGISIRCLAQFLVELLRILSFQSCIMKNYKLIEYIDLKVLHSVTYKSRDFSKLPLINDCKSMYASGGHAYVWVPQKLKLMVKVKVTLPPHLCGIF